MAEIIAGGHLCLDLLPRMSNVPLEGVASPGKLFEIDPLDMATGGSVSNTGLALQRLGADVGLMGTVGDDLLGRVIIAMLKDRDPALSEMVRVVEGAASSYSVLLSPGNSDRIVLHCTGTNATFDAADIDFDKFANAKIFHLGYPPILPKLIDNDGDQLTEVYRRAKATGVVTSMDMALPDPNSYAGNVNWPLILEKTLPFVDVFIPSIEEIVFMVRRADYDTWNGDVMPNIDKAYVDALANDLLALGTAVVGVKLGEMGMTLRTTANADRLSALGKLPVDLDAWRDVDLYHPAFTVEVAGTTGAGDAAYAGFLMSLLRGLSPHEALQMAGAAGAYNIESVDATSGMRPWDETRARVQAGWDTVAVRLPGAV